jgi:DNA-directed RNA polymerase specialized sigma24 family protein
MTTPAAPPLAPSHLHLVHAAALRQTRNPDAAADITQAVFLLLARKCAAHRAPLDARLIGWLLTVTAYTVKAWQRSQRRPPRLPRTPCARPPGTPRHAFH